MKIFLGTVEIGGTLPVYAEGFRKLGHEVATGVHVGHEYRFDKNLSYDVALRPNDMRQAKEIIAYYDVFLFQFGHSLLHNNRDFPIIKNAGKKLISLFNGSDVRYWNAYEQQFGIDYQELLQEEPPDYWRKDTLLQVLSVLRNAEIYADIILSTPNQSLLGLRPYNHFFYPMIPDDFTFAVPGREVPVVVHAPSNTATKGTKLILSALDELKAENVAFDLRLLTDTPNEKVREVLTEADCVIDQTLLGYGLFAAEGMASGCAAATGHFPTQEAIARLRPIHGLHPHSLKENLRTLLTNRELRIKLAYEGRKHVEKYHDVTVICRNILHDLDSTQNGAYDYWPEFYATAFELPSDVNIPQEFLEQGERIIKQWGVPVTADLSAMARRGLLTSMTMPGALARWDSMPPDCMRYSAHSSATQDENTTSQQKGIARIGEKRLNGPTAETYDNQVDVLLSAHGKHDFFNLFPAKNFPATLRMPLRRALACGELEKAALLLWRAVEKDEGSSRLAEALALLFVGQGRYDLAEKLYQPLGDVPSLLNWFMGIHWLQNKSISEALPLLLPFLSASPSCAEGARKQSIELEPSAVTGGVCAILRSTLHNSYCRYSLAALTPNWCVPDQKSIIIEHLLLLAIREGFAIRWNGNWECALPSRLQQLIEEVQSI